MSKTKFLSSCSFSKHLNFPKNINLHANSNSFTSKVGKSCFQNSCKKTNLLKKKVTIECWLSAKQAEVTLKLSDASCKGIVICSFKFCSCPKFDMEVEQLLSTHVTYLSFEIFKINVSQFKINFFYMV